jgi:hypothetical protein
VHLFFQVDTSEDQAAGSRLNIAALSLEPIELRFNPIDPERQTLSFDCMEHPAQAAWD